MGQMNQIMDKDQELAMLRSENEDMRNDIKLMAITIKQIISDLGFLDEQGNFKFETRSIGKLLPLAVSGKLNDQLTGLGAILPLFDKYKHFAE
ncbi:MAG: hypothetical protein M9888_03790 [Chitinophagales bacterium]|nr:hypothetical protein [Chitinophagales bacterium]